MKMYYYVNIKEQDHGVVFADSEDEARDILVKAFRDVRKTKKKYFIFPYIFSEVNDKHVAPFGYLNAEYCSKCGSTWIVTLENGTHCCVECNHRFKPI